MAADDPAAAAERRDREKTPPGVMTFDVPAQPLISALETYGAISGWQVVYDADLARGRQSMEVKGAFTPDVALQRLLAGTGLSPRYMAADGFVLVQDPVAKSAGVNTASPDAVMRYYGRIQAGLRRTFCADRRARAGGYRVAVGLWIGSSGVVSRSALLDSTGDSDLDATLDRAVRSVNIGEPPPAGFAQPIVMVITPDVMQDCLGAQHNVQQSKARP
ncbi:TonB family protein [Bradyrhizobium neotropicale]|uniref:TonB family protein n=1 Tax=Bradyrhizobium neotropicale TaxID=1497615 RepID=UPI001AD70A60|nr:TonB family protein [Bradyrhizobium neotropicale]MBO4224087.1 TonB family protein [Bradyrhizobium neotropicale]